MIEEAWVGAPRAAVLDAAAGQERDMDYAHHAVRTCRGARGQAAEAREKDREERWAGRWGRQRSARTDGAGGE